MIEGVLFDMDGVLVDTESIGMGYMHEICARYGYQADRALYISVLGIPNHDSRAIFLRRFGPEFPFDEYMAEFNRRLAQRSETGGTPPKPGLYECLRALKADGIKLAVATSTNRALASLYFERLGLDQLMDATVCGDEIAHGKPAPDIYLAAAEALALRPEACLGVEDSANGLKALNAAGVPGVMIPDLVPYGEIFHGMVSHVLPSLLELPPLIKRLNATLP